MDIFLVSINPKLFLWLSFFIDIFHKKISKEKKIVAKVVV